MLLDKADDHAVGLHRRIAGNDKQVVERDTGRLAWQSQPGLLEVCEVLVRFVLGVQVLHRPDAHLVEGQSCLVDDFCLEWRVDG